MPRLSANITEIASYIGSDDFLSLKDSKITNFRPLSQAGPGDFTFCSVAGKTGADLVRSSRASLIICSSKLKPLVRDCNSSLIFVDEPRLWFIRCLKHFAGSIAPKGIHSTAVVRSKLTGKDVYVGPFSFIDRNVTVGDNTVIHGGVHIYGNTSIGSRVTIDSCAVSRVRRSLDYEKK
jgi:UDP-3-O-[3-hydroxymyristoyl] glucosamine N-acyltransferase